MNANGFKKFEHDSPYGRFGFRQNLPVCIQHHGSGIPSARRSQTETTDTSRCRSSSLRVIRAPEEKTKHGLPTVNGNAEERFTG